MDKTIDIIIGANYGDCGKGRITQYLANQYDKEHTLVIRSTSGFQCSHTVHSGDKRFIFHGFGSGTLDGYPTFLSNGVVVNPIVFRQEMEQLKALGCNPKIYIHRRCYVTLPTHMLANQCTAKLYEFFGDRDGTCGIGVWETMNDHVCGNTYVNVNKLKSKKFFDKCRKSYGSEKWFKSRIFGEHSESMITDYEESTEIYTKFCEMNVKDSLWERFYDDLQYMYNNATIVEDIDDIPDITHYVFEMSQGLLLSANNCRRGGIAHDCSATGCASIVRDLARRYDDVKFNVNLNYVTRWYRTRHGCVALENKRKREDISPDIVDETNIPNEWQGEMVFGLLDVTHLINRISADFMGFSQIFDDCFPNINIMCRSLFITCIDQIRNGYLPYMRGGYPSRENSLSRFVADIIQGEVWSNIYLCLSESNDDIVPVHRKSGTMMKLEEYIYNGKEGMHPRTEGRRTPHRFFYAPVRSVSVDDSCIPTNAIEIENNGGRRIVVDNNGIIYALCDDDMNILESRSDCVGIANNNVDTIRIDLNVDEESVFD